MKFIRRNLLKNQCGATLLEMMGVLAVAGILTAGIWKLTDHALYRYRISQVTIQVQSLQKGISRFFASKGNYDALDEEGTVAKLFENNAIPSDMRAEEGKIRHVFGEEVVLANLKYANEASNASTGFSITFTGLSKRVCIEVATISWPENDMANMISIKIGDTKFVWPSYASASDDVKVLPVTMSDAIGECASDNNEEAKSITWEFR